MWFWAVNEMTEPVSGCQHLNSGTNLRWVWGSELVQGSSGSCVSFCLMSDGFACPRLKTTGVAELDWCNKPSGVFSGGWNLSWGSCYPDRGFSRYSSVTPWGFHIEHQSVTACHEPCSNVCEVCLLDVAGCSPLLTGCTSLWPRRREFPKPPLWEPVYVFICTWIHLIICLSVYVFLCIKKTKLRGLSPRTNYTDRATAACRRSDCQLLRIEGATWSAWLIPTAVFPVF
jgi:hypothetical protein